MVEGEGVGGWMVEREGVGGWMVEGEGVGGWMVEEGGGSVVRCVVWGLLVVPHKVSLRVHL